MFLAAILYEVVDSLLVATWKSVLMLTGINRLEARSGEDESNLHTFSYISNIGAVHVF